MPNGQDFTPDYVFNLIRESPQGRSFVENLAKMNDMQRAMQQFAPTINQFAQNPSQAMSNIGDWAQSANNQLQAQTQQQQVQPQPQQQNNGITPIIKNNNEQAQQAPGGNQTVPNTLDMAMQLVEEFRKSLKVVNDNLKEVYEMQESFDAKLDSIVGMLENKSVKKAGGKNVPNPTGETSGDTE